MGRFSGPWTRVVTAAVSISITLVLVGVLFRHTNDQIHNLICIQRANNIAALSQRPDETQAAWHARRALILSNLARLRTSPCP